MIFDLIWPLKYYRIVWNKGLDTICPLTLVRNTNLSVCMCVYLSICLFADLPPFAVDVSDAVGQRVWSQQRGGALRPVRGHQRVFAHQNFTHVLCTRHSDQRPAQQMGLEHVAVLLPPWRMETRTLDGEETWILIIELKGFQRVQRSCGLFKRCGVKITFGGSFNWIHINVKRVERLSVTGHLDTRLMDELLMKEIIHTAYSLHKDLYLHKKIHN